MRIFSPSSGGGGRMHRDMDETIQGWPYEPQPGEVLAREVRARDGRMVIQIRVELGVLQLEVVGRPDGTRPHGFVTFLDYLRQRASGRDQAPGGKVPSWRMAPEHCIEADREFVQYYHRRVAWLALHQFEMALLDADHTLALMDFVRQHGIDDEYIASHERFRGLVLFQRTQAAAALALERRRPEEAIDAIHEGLVQLAALQNAALGEPDRSEPSYQALIEQLRNSEQQIRKNFAVEKTLREQLDEAIAVEDYERAARIRDQIRDRARR